MVKLKTLYGILVEEQVRQVCVLVFVQSAVDTRKNLVSLSVGITIYRIEFVEIDFCREERVGIRAATIYIVGIVRLDLVVELYQVLHTSLIAIALVGVEG